MDRRAFTLIELLVVIAIIALLIAILLPALGAARESGRAAVCLSNLRQCFIACRAYADENKGIGPALGQPYLTLPNWALVVQESSGFTGAGTESYNTRSALVCPSARAFYARDMQRTYAMNVTGLAGAPGDPANFDDPGNPGHVKFDSVMRPADALMLLDSAAIPTGPELPPPTRTASTLDFRNADHVSVRLGHFHGGENQGHFEASFYDGSAREQSEVKDDWLEPLP